MNILIFESNFSKSNIDGWVAFINIFKDDYKLFTNNIFDKEKDADEFGRKSMKRGYEYKVLDYNNENHDRYWNGN